MFYDTRDGSRTLPHDPFKAIIAPRPIGWISSISAKGEVNRGPYSFFNCAHSKSNLVLFASESFKDSVANIEETGEFVCSLATWDLREEMNVTSAPMPRGQNEMDRAKLAPAPSRLVEPPRVAASPCALECKMTQLIQLKDADGRDVDGYVVFGRVIGVYIDDRFIKDGRLDTAAMERIARFGSEEYAVVETMFAMTRPTV